MDYGLIPNLTILIVLLTLSALFSGAETALSSLSIIKIKQLQQRGVKGTNILERLLKNSSKTLSTILIGNNIVNIAATAIATELTIEIFTGKQVTVFVTIIMTILILVFGEITPKTYASHNAEKVAMKLGKPLNLLSIIFTPVLFILNRITKIIIKILGGDLSSDKTTISEEEIKTLVDVGEEAGIIEKQEREMINSIFEIGDIEASEVMVPRIDIVYLDENDTMNDAIEKALKYGYSRIPVITNSIDNIIGILYVKDLLASFFNANNQEESIKELIRPAYYVPESKKAIDLLTEMQLQKVHIAIVLDEYSGTLGLVTIENILEEIVGDIIDEYDDEKDLVEYIEGGGIIVNSKISIDEINDIYDANLPEDEFESIGGFVFNLLGRMPRIGDTVKYNDINFKVLELHNRRISKMRIDK